VKPRELEHQLAAIGSLDGLMGCAVVDSETGMAWQSFGGEDMQIVCEAASDFWRLQMRQPRQFSSQMGELSAQVLIHGRGRITSVKCGRSLLLVCVSREPDQVDWKQWKVLVARLRAVAAST
jgi:hypothetical protein